MKPYVVIIIVVGFWWLSGHYALQDNWKMSMACFLLALINGLLFL